MNRRRSVSYTENHLFRGIPRDVLRDAALTPHRVSVDAGDLIFEEGDPPDCLYLVVSGAVRITKGLPGGRHELLATIEPGEFFGELGPYDSLPRSARATAAIRSRMICLSQADFERLRRIAPLQVASNLADAAIERVRLTNTRLVSGIAAAGRLSEVGSDLGALSHNLRSPLATIRNAADMLAEWLEQDPTARQGTTRFVEIIRSTADKALSQIDILMAKLRGDVVDDRLNVATDDILRDLREMTLGYLANPAIRYHDESSSYHGHVSVERAEFVAVLVNLVKNSVEALPAEGGEIAVSVTQEGRSVVFSVSDTGTGISPEFLPLLFERDFTHGKNGGTGIGLAHAQAVAEKHGGRIYVESEVGRGTTVRVRLPWVGE